LLERKEEYVKCLQMLLREAEKKRYAVTSQMHYGRDIRESQFAKETSRLPMAT